MTMLKNRRFGRIDTNSLQPLESPIRVNTTVAFKRLQRELMKLMTSERCNGISAFPDADDIMSWTATIDGLLILVSWGSSLSEAHEPLKTVIIKF